MKAWITARWIDKGIFEVEGYKWGDDFIADSPPGRTWRYCSRNWHPTLEAAIAHVEAEIAKARHAVNRKIEKIARASDMIAKLKGPSQ